MISVIIENLDDKTKSLILNKCAIIKSKKYNDIIIDHVISINIDCSSIYLHISPKLWNAFHKDFVHKMDELKNAESTNDREEMIYMKISVRGQNPKKYNIDRSFYDVVNHNIYQMKSKFTSMLYSYINYNSDYDYHDIYDLVNDCEWTELNSIRKPYISGNSDDECTLDAVLDTFNDIIYRPVMDMDIDLLYKNTLRNRKNIDIRSFRDTIIHIMNDVSSQVQLKISHIKKLYTAALVTTFIMIAIMIVVLFRGGYIS